MDPSTGQGATFRLWFPLSDFTEADQPRSESWNPRLLVVGREFALDEAASALRSTGCRVTATEHHGTEILNTASEAYDALVLLNGVGESEARPLIHSLRARRWKTRVIRESPVDPASPPWGIRPDLSLPHPLHQSENCAKLRAALMTHP